MFRKAIAVQGRTARLAHSHAQYVELVLRVLWGVHIDDPSTAASGAAATWLFERYGQRIIKAQLFAGVNIAQCLQLRPTVTFAGEPCLNHYVRLAGVVDPPRLIDHVKEDARSEDQRIPIISLLTLAPQYAVDVHYHRSLKAAPGGDDAISFDRRTYNSQTWNFCHGYVTTVCQCFIICCTI